MTYDFENRLTRLVDQAASQAWNYLYDYRMRRVQVTPSPATSGTGPQTSFVFSGGNAVQEWASGALTVENIRGSDMGGGVGGILYTLRAGSAAFTHYNSRGDVVRKTASSGDSTYAAAYDAFGTHRYEQGATSDRQKANTKDEDPTGLLNEGFRYRDLETGVFVTRDPLRFIDGPNLYKYVRQNPWSKFDPNGLTQWHHLYPQEYADAFRAMGIDVHSGKNGIFLPDNVHRKIHGKDRIVDWNAEWKGFLDTTANVEASARKQKAEEFLEHLKNEPKFAQFLRKGYKIPDGMNYTEYQDLMKKYTVEEKSKFFADVWRADKTGKILKYVKEAGKVVGKLVEVGELALAVEQFGEGRSYAKDVYGAGPVGQTVSGVAQAVLPVEGPADATATWDMTQQEVARGNSGWHAMFETFLNPASPRWLPTQIMHGVWESVSR